MALLKERITTEMKTAMKSGDKSRLAVIRLIMAAIKQREVDERIELDEGQIIAVLDKMLKQRRESIRQFSAAERVDLIAIEEFEITVIQDFLPKALSDEEIGAMISDAVQQLGASSIKDMGKLMGVLTEKMQGRADMSVVSAKVKAILVNN